MEVLTRGAGRDRGGGIDGVSEAVGTIILVGMVMIGVALVGGLLLSGQSSSSVPALDTIITNQSKSIYLYHKGGDPLYPGQYKIIVDGVDLTANASIMSPGTYPWSVGETLNVSVANIPKLVVIVFNSTGGGMNVLDEADLTREVPVVPTFVQANAANSNSVAFPSASGTGDLIALGNFWSSQAVTITGVTDNKGNVYRPAVGPTNWGGASYRGAIWYAPNITGGAGAITVTVAYSGAQGATYTYIAEYSGVATLNPLDAVSAGIGSTASLSSGTNATGQGTELIFGYAMSENTATVDPSFTARSTFSNNFIADRTVTRAGYYSVFGTNSAGNWLCQMATFRG